MSQSWDDIKLSIEAVETERALDSIQRMLHGDENRRSCMRRELLTLLGGVCAGVSAGIITCMFNYLLFVWLLHIEF